jgi:hypothetical protein
MARTPASRRRGDGRRTRRIRSETGEHDLFDPPAEKGVVEDLTLPQPPPSSPAGVPKSWVKFLVGLFLLAPAWILSRTFLQAFAADLQHGLLASRPFGCFAAGMVLFAILFLIIPRSTLMIPYVFGHELTHALWVKLFGGKVADQFHVSLDGGHVLTDRVNTWIALSPYFFPFYSVLVLTLYGAGSFVTDLTPWNWVLYLLLGFTLAFHLVFTCLLILRGQPDLHYGGTFFSLMVIYLINLLILTAMLLAAGKEVTLRSLCEGFFRNGEEFVRVAGGILSWIADTAADLISSWRRGA